MLTIRRAQIAAFEEARAAALPGKITEYLVDRFPTETKELPPPVLEQLIRRGMNSAASYGVTVEWDLCRFCWLELLHGPDFDKTVAWATEILAEPDLTPQERIDMLEEYQLNYVQVQDDIQEGDDAFSSQFRL